MHLLLFLLFINLLINSWISVISQFSRAQGNICKKLFSPTNSPKIFSLQWYKTEKKKQILQVTFSYFYF